MIIPSWIPRIVKTYIPIIIAAISLVVSIFALTTANKAYEYDVYRNKFWDTPALVDISDSTEVKFTLNKEHDQLQSLLIIFPEEIFKNDPEVHTKPLAFSRDYLELMVKGYLSDILHHTDSTVTVGTYPIPVIIDYSAIAGSEPTLLREERNLLFDVYMDRNGLSVTYNTSILTRRPKPDQNKDIEDARPELKRQLSDQLQSRQYDSLHN